MKTKFGRVCAVHAGCLAGLFLKIAQGLHGRIVQDAGHEVELDCQALLNQLVDRLARDEHGRLRPGPRGQT